MSAPNNQTVQWGGFFPQNNGFNNAGALSGENFPTLGGGPAQVGPTQPVYNQQQQFAPPQQYGFPQYQQQFQGQPQPGFNQAYAMPGQQFYQPQMPGYPAQQAFQPFNMAPLQATLPAPVALSGQATTSAMPTSGFSMGSQSFVPKSKRPVEAAQPAKTAEEFPTLGESAKDTKSKKKPQEKKKEEEDPCYGKPKEFFIYDMDPVTNSCFCSTIQLAFISQYYPEHYFTPIDILMWLYDTAFYFEEQAEIARQDAVYSTGPSGRGKVAEKSKATGGKKKTVSDEIDDYEDTSFGPKSYKDLKAKKPAAPPKAPAAGAGKQITEEQRIAKLKQMQAQQASREMKISKDVVGREKTAEALLTSQSEPILEVDETRAPVSLVCIGHVDAGKSTISGNIMFETGVVDARTIQKYKEEAKEKNRESWWLAYAMDVCEEEKAKGKTVEIGRANFETPTKRWTIFDAPGHKNYVPNMIMGASLADYGALVISAKKGEFESGFDAEGQTREHVMLAKSLGIFKLVVVVNKMDEASVKWSKERYTDIVSALRPFLKAAGYDPDTDCTFVPCSALTGENITKKPAAGVCNWYQDGRTFMEILDTLPLPQRFESAPLRVPVMDKMQDRGCVVFGKVEQGTIKLGDLLKLMPSGISCQVQTIYDSKERNVRYAKPGENVKLRLNIESEDNLNKGDVLCLRDQATVPVSELFEAEVDLLELISYKPIMTKGYQCMLHIHTVADDATVKEILVSYEKNEKGETVEKQKPQFSRSYAKIICRIQTRIPIALEKADTLAALGRFTMRDEGKTIAVGKVLKYKPAKAELPGTGAASIAAAKPTATEEAKAKAPELVFDMETGETVSREEYDKRKKDRVALEGVDEEDEGEDDEGTQTNGSSKAAAASSTK